LQGAIASHAARDCRQFTGKDFAMFDRPLDCLITAPQGAPRPLHAMRPEGLEAWLAGLPRAQAGFLRESLFTAKPGQIALLPGDEGVAGAVIGLGTEPAGPHVFGALPGGLPAGSLWRSGDGIEDEAALVLGFCLGAYRFDAFKSDAPPPRARLAMPAQPSTEVARAVSAARAVWLARDLINTPANALGPAELADTAYSVLSRAGAHADVITGARLAAEYPALHAVGRASSRVPAVLVGHWRGSQADNDSPLVSLCGKGVCFDTGGYDLKPSAAMLRMKKDMGGAAIALALARMVMEADLPLRLQLRLGCVDNMISGDAMRPLDILKTRKGVSVEVGNTDAEGRLVLCDLLAEASEYSPDILIDFATLTGAARVALGPDLPALFSNDDVLAETFAEAGRVQHDPVWRLPIWDGYNNYLDSDAGDLNNVSDKPYAGAILAALFLKRFVTAGIRWAHFDVYAWNDATRPGRPAGGDAQALRAVFGGLIRLFGRRGDDGSG
jgi:leucyl aminopeptidase